MAPNGKVIFIGNPGVGKSTLLNCLLQEKAKFESGLSMAQGKTKFLQGYKAPSGITYYDTPGLSDVVLRKQAAEEIKKALLPAAGQQQSECQVFFVVTLEAGRVRPDDKVTINLVLEAAEEIGTNYSIIINKLPKNTYDKIMASDDIKYTLRTSLLDGLHFPTVSIYFSMKNADLDDQDNALVALSPDLLNFIHNSKPVPCITQVQDIDCDKYEKLANMLMEQLEEMKSDRAVLERKMQEQAERYKVLMKEQEKYLEQEKNRKTGFGEAVGVVLRPWKWFG